MGVYIGYRGQLILRFTFGEIYSLTIELQKTPANPRNRHTMLQARLLRTCYHASHSSQLAFRTYSSNKSSNEIPDFEAARQWFQTFNPSKPQSSESALPSTKIAKTEYSRASGPGGQKTNKYLSLLPLIIPSSQTINCRWLTKNVGVKDEFQSNNSLAPPRPPKIHSQSSPSRTPRQYILRLFFGYDKNIL